MRGWPEAAKTWRIKLIRRLIDNLPADEVAVWEDEVDIHLNPKLGADWMNRGQQKQVRTPGRNRKRYLAGTLDAVTGRMTWVGSDRKNSDLFIALLKGWTEVYREAKRAHVILETIASIPAGSRSGRWKRWGGIVLHFLPPYCPQYNRIERRWLDLHTRVTRNHNHATMPALMRDVRTELRRQNRKHARAQRQAA